jgi:hypothetical protein
VKKSPDKTPALGSIHRDEVLPVREAARRLGWNRAAISVAQHNGLRTARCGRFSITTGSEIFRYVESMMRRGEDPTE